jgi:uncharacterized DUF497 family protein
MLYEDERFEWDTDKDLLNQQNHNGLSFAEAKLVFDDPNMMIEKDRIDDETGEQRWHAIGEARNDLLLIVHVYRVKENGIEKIRIISAWSADKSNRGRYR